jgi:hypothetical protein
MRTVLAFLVILLGMTSTPHAGQVSITQWYDLNIWRFPDPSQDPDNLPSDPSAINYNSNFVQSNIGPAPFNETYVGTTPLGDGHQNSYDFHVIADSSFTELKAQLSTEFTDFSAANYTPGLYVNSDGDVVSDTNFNLGHVTSLVHDFIKVTGVGGPIQLTMVFDLHGEVQADGGFGSYATNFPVAFGELVLGSFDFNADDRFLLNESGLLNQEVSLHTTILGDSESFIQYGLSLNAYLPDLSLLPPGYAYNGILNFDIANTAVVKQIILTLPAGTNLANVQYQFGSGTRHNVLLRVNSVPEPSSIALLFVGACCVAAARVRRKPVSGAKISG